MLNLKWWEWNTAFPKGLVNMFATWRWEGGKMVCTSLDWIFSLIRWQSNLMCFVLSWKTRFVAMCMTTWLSQCIFVAPKLVTCRSWRKYLNQLNSQVRKVMALYSASVKEWDILVCFLVFQEMSGFPRKTQYPVIDFLMVARATSLICITKFNKLQIIFG